MIPEPEIPFHIQKLIRERGERAALDELLANLKSHVVSFGSGFKVKVEGRRLIVTAPKEYSSMSTLAESIVRFMATEEYIVGCEIRVVDRKLAVIIPSSYFAEIYQLVEAGYKEAKACH